jgi:prephenate dehydrogenase
MLEVYYYFKLLSKPTCYNLFMKIGIVGLGLIGGSLGLAIKAQSTDTVIGVARREETVQLAQKIGAIDQGASEEKQGNGALELLRDADVVFVCTPIHLTLKKLQEIAPLLKKGAILTDVASVKNEIVAQVGKIIPKGVFFVGGHPMAGKEKAKLENAEAGLFQNRPWVLINKGSAKARTKLALIITSIGGKVIEMNAKQHDLAVAGISHVPIVVASALVNAVAESKSGVDEMKALASSGFKDTTRVASGEVEMGREILVNNKRAVLKQLRNFKTSLKVLEKAIKQGDAKEIENLLAKAKQFRDNLNATA